MRPDASIFPLVKVAESGELVAFLGTGFLVAERPMIVTAKHVLTQAPLLEGERFAIALLQRKADLPLGETVEDIPIHPLGAADLSCIQDIAAIEVTMIPGIVPLSLCSSDAHPDEDVIAYECSNTLIDRAPDGTRRITFDSFIHKGNIVRYYVNDAPGGAQGPLFETSFPAMRGASGAPVLRHRGLAVTGMLVGNAERHLLPAQIERVDSTDGIVEEIHYFLPFGQALQLGVIADYLASIGVQPGIAS